MAFSTQRIAKRSELESTESPQISTQDRHLPDKGLSQSVEEGDARAIRVHSRRKWIALVRAIPADRHDIENLVRCMIHHITPAIQHQADKSLTTVTSPANKTTLASIYIHT